MTTSKERKTLQLGMNPSTASGRLKKDLLYHLAGKCDMLNCHRCGEYIESSSVFSVEHIEDWYNSEDPLGIFFDVDNIAFSHLVCNTEASSSKLTPEITHGTSHGYDGRGCRCDLCKEAKAHRASTTYNTKSKRAERYQRTKI